MQRPSRQPQRKVKRQSRPDHAASVLVVPDAARDPDGLRPTATTNEQKGKREPEGGQMQSTTWDLVGHWQKWAGQVSIRISSRKKGALSHLSYRPACSRAADSPSCNTK